MKKGLIVVVAVIAVVVTAMAASKEVAVVERECNEREALLLAKEVSENFSSDVLIRGEHSYYVGKIGIVEIVGKPTICNGRIQYFSVMILRKIVYCMIAVAVVAEFTLFVVAGMNTLRKRVRMH